MRSLITTLLIALALPVFGQYAGNEHPKGPFAFELSVDRQSSSSGHSNFFTIGPSFSYWRNSLYIGALYGDREQAVRGFKLDYRFYPILVGERTYPYFQYSLIGRWDSRLAKDVEKRLHQETWSGAQGERYRTIEHYFGFGLKSYVVGTAYFDLGIGLGMYSSELTSEFDHRIPDPSRYRDNMDVSLSLDAGIGYRF